MKTAVAFLVPLICLAPLSMAASTGAQANGLADLPPLSTTGALRPTGPAGGLKVLDWAGFSAAVTYTFDDALASQLANYAQLHATGVRMTFLRFRATGTTPAGSRPLTMETSSAITPRITAIPTEPAAASAPEPGLAASPPNTTSATSSSKRATASAASGTRLRLTAIPGTMQPPQPGSSSIAVYGMDKLLRATPPMPTICLLTWPGPATRLPFSMSASTLPAPRTNGRSFSSTLSAAMADMLP